MSVFNPACVQSSWAQGRKTVSLHQKWQNTTYTSVCLLLKYNQTVRVGGILAISQPAQTPGKLQDEMEFWFLGWLVQFLYIKQISEL